MSGDRHTLQDFLRRPRRLHLDKTRRARKGHIRCRSEHYEQEDLVFSYKNCVVVTHDKKIIGMLIAFPMEIESGFNDLEEDPVLVPYNKLEEANSYYIWEMALVPEYRNQGIGRKLLALAEDKAKEMSYEKLSLIVFEQNEGALSLYERHGFEEVAREPVVPHLLIRHTGDVLLMVKTIN